MSLVDAIDFMSQALTYRHAIIVGLRVYVLISTMSFLIFHRLSCLLTGLIDGLSISHSLPLS